MIALLLMMVLPHAVQAQGLADETDPFWAATNSQVLSSPCMRSQPFSESEMTDWLNQNRPARPGPPAQVKGYTFVDENLSLIEGFKLLVNAPQVNPVSASSCRQVLCAVKEVFGPTGTQLIFMLERFGLNGSHLTNANASAWTKDELDVILMGIASYPENTFPQVRSHPLVHGTRGSGNTEVADSTIEIYDEWNKYARGLKMYTPVHELAHKLSNWNQDIDYSQSWLQMTQAWESKTETRSNGSRVTLWTPIKKDAFVSRYAATLPSEDFAETLTAYRFNPSVLKKVSPARYQWVKEFLFDGLEYTSEASCDPENALSRVSLRKIQNELRSAPLNEATLKSVEQKCGGIAISKLGESMYTLAEDSDLLQCVSTGIKEAVARQVMGKDSHLSFVVSDSFVKSEWLSGAVSTLAADLKKSLASAARYHYSRVADTYQGNCVDGSKFGYQNVSSREFGDKYSPEDSKLVFTYRLKEPLTRIMLETCKALKMKRSLNDAAYEEVVSRFLN